MQRGYSETRRVTQVGNGGDTSVFDQIAGGTVAETKFIDFNLNKDLIAI